MFQIASIITLPIAKLFFMAGSSFVIFAICFHHTFMNKVCQFPLSSCTNQFFSMFIEISKAYYLFLRKNRMNFRHIYILYFLILSINVFLFGGHRFHIFIYIQALIYSALRHIAGVFQLFTYHIPRRKIHESSIHIR